MKKVFLLGMMLFSMFSITMAQPAMITKGLNDQNKRDTLTVEIVNYQTGEHFQHPSTGLMCPFSTYFVTEWDYSTMTMNYDWYQWETSFPIEMGCQPDEPVIYCTVRTSGFVKITAGKDGNITTDSIWFNIKTISQMDNFIMEIGEDLKATFSGTPHPDHTDIWIEKESSPGQIEAQQIIPLTPGYEWEFTDNSEFGEKLWMYYSELHDTCSSYLTTLIPGVVLDTKAVTEEWYLNMESILQNGGQDFYLEVYGTRFVYFVYTVDENGVRHHFVENGNPVILTPETAEWQIPGTHPDPYYQCGVAQVMDDGSYLLLSFSNKVENPLPDLNEIEEVTEQISVYPNPAKGQFAVEGNGLMHISNVLGQEIMAKEIDGKETVELPKGMYFVQLNGTVRKIVVE